MSEIKIDMRVSWQDGDIARVGWVWGIFDSGRAYVQDEAMYTFEVDVKDLTPAPLTEQERAELTTLLGYEPREVT